MKIGFIGVGNMGGALLEGFIAHGALQAGDAGAVSRGDAGRRRAEKAGAALFADGGALAGFADMAILAVKPQDARAALDEARDALRGKALLSIVAGLGREAIAARLDARETRVLIALPNAPALVGEGVVGFARGTTFTVEEAAAAEKLFGAVATVEWVDEKLMGALSALSGSGPAFAAIFAESLADGGVACGLPRALASRLAARTLIGTGALLSRTGVHPGALKDAVSSPGGTTIEGVAALEEGAFRGAVMDAVRRAADKFTRLL
ncbi:MAG: pyrroline-5-carboxylate reductase [Spirochaetaceae bacterium]|nr:pyrroline-5-carboxylate reductase [Spirochaetaceae bacterium]